MATIMVFVLMVAAAVLPLVGALYWMRRGKVGYTLTLFALLGACLVITMFGATTPIGLDPLIAISAALLVFLPATLGCTAGALLGWLLDRRRDRAVRADK